MEILLTRSWLKAFSGLLINLSAALLVAPFIGYTIALPQTFNEFAILLVDFGTAIIFLLLTVWCEKRLDRRRKNE